MSEPVTDLPPCPHCQLVAHRVISILGDISYQCNNEQCDLFPATDYHPKDQDARTEWINITTQATPQ